MSLPELIVFSVKLADQEDRYLSITGPQRQLRCGTEDGVFSATAKFAVEPVSDGLVHIRSCYENHYWARASRSEPWLLASSPESVEDMSDDGCTLFRPRISAGNVTVGFVHVQSGLNVVMRPPTDAHAYNLCVERAAATDFNFVDYSPLTRTKLPRYVRFLGDNDMYMRTRLHPELVVWLCVDSDSPTDRAVVFEVVYAKSGDMQVKSILYDDFWVVDSTVVLIDLYGKATPPLMKALFEVNFSSPPNTREVGVALRCRGFEEFCNRLYSDIIDPPQITFDLFVIGAASLDNRQAWLRIRPAAHQDRRRVNIESFRHAWLALKSTELMTELKFSNTRDTPYEHTITVSTLPLTETTFSSSISFFTGPPAVFNGRMPSVTSSGKLEFPDVETDTKTDWGTTKRIFGLAKKYDLKVIFPPKTLVTVTVFSEVVTYEIPFSYEQLDEFPFGGTVTQHLSDGVYIIQHEYNVGSTSQYEPLSRSESDVQVGTELPGAPGIFVYKVFEAQDRTKTVVSDEGPDSPEAKDVPRPESFDQGSDAQGSMTAEESYKGTDATEEPRTELSDQVVKALNALTALAGIKLDASQEVDQE